MMVAQKFASFLTSLRSIALSLLLIILFAWNFGSINTSAKDVLAMVPRIQQFEARGAKITPITELPGVISSLTYCGALNGNG
jgi:hypothetical protein